MVYIIAAVTNSGPHADYIGGIGKNGELPWYIKNELKFFKSMTEGNVVVMGGNTYRSLGKPLPNRENIVLSRNMKKTKGVTVFNRVGQLDDYIKNNDKKKKIFIIGGASLYKRFIKKDICTEIYYTQIEKSYHCDTFFPVISSDYKLVYTSEKQYDNCEKTFYRFLKYKRHQDIVDESEYLKLGKIILENGHFKQNRTGIDTLSVFSHQMRFNVAGGIPLLTNKKVPWKMCIEELLWFLRGETDVKILQDKGIKIWNGNTSREFLDKMGFHDVPEWELQRGYGHQIRRYGPNKVDQLSYVENLLKTDPNSRRIMWNLWNASDLDQMVLTPCFLGDNEVSTKRGYVKAKDVTKEDYLYTHKGKYQKCMNVQESIYKGEVYQFSLKDNPVNISCTEDHLFYVYDETCQQKIWLEASELKKTQRLCIKVNKESVRYGNDWYFIGYQNELSESEKEYIQSLDTELILHFLKGYTDGGHALSSNTDVLFLQRLYAKTGKFAKFVQGEWELSPLDDPDWLWYKIDDIISYEEKGVKVYNFETQNDHTYVVANCVAHNCHNQVQFYVKDGKYLSAQLYCRSSDYFLGLPFNIFSYTVLLYILAKRCDLIPDELVVTLGDAHIYENHIAQVKEMMERDTRSLPFLTVNDSVKNKEYEEINIDDFDIIGYFPQATIKAKMAV